MSKKTIQGEGWKLISADDENKAPETIIISKAPEQQNLKIFLEKRKTTISSIRCDRMHV